MLLLDTSIWIDLLRGQDNAGVRFALQREPAEDLALTAMTYLEVLQGARSAAELNRLSNLLQSRVLPEPSELAIYESAARMYFTTRRRGLTIRTAVDCLIAAVAVERELVLVHNDRDFFALAVAEPRLQLYPPAPQAH